MKAFMLFTGSGPLVILTSHQSVTELGLVNKFRAKGIDKFIAHELPLPLARERYGGHFDAAIKDLHETTICAFSTTTPMGVPSVPPSRTRPPDPARAGVIAAGAPPCASQERVTSPICRP